MVKNALASLYLFLVLSNHIIANQNSEDSTGEKSGGFFGVPFVMYSPETEWGFGGAGMLYFYPQKIVKPYSRLSSLLASATYTTKKQISSEINYDIYLSDEHYRFYGRVSYAKYPYSFFGTGNNTSDLNEEKYTPTFFTIESTFLKQLIHKSNSSLNAGFRYDFRTDRIIESEYDKMISSGVVSGCNGGIISGIGLTVNWDSRDNAFISSSGEYIDLKVNFYRGFLLSDFNFNSYIADLRKFYSIKVFETTHVLAVNFVSRFTYGDIPFYMLSTFGGDKLMRGYFEGRFRDKNMISLQTDYRLPLFWRFGLVAFGGIGQVQPDIKKFKLQDMKFSYGLGIRFIVIPEEKIGGRIDVGFSSYGSQFYLSFSEAF